MKLVYIFLIQARKPKSYRKVNRKSYLEIHIGGEYLETIIGTGLVYNYTLNLN